jgi:hypothetical protein
MIGTLTWVMRKGSETRHVSDVPPYRAPSMGSYINKASDVPSSRVSKNLSSRGMATSLCYGCNAL